MPERIYDNRICDRLKVASWILEFIELLISILILGITISAAQGMKTDLGFPNIPGKLAYNIAIAALTIFVLLPVFILDVFVRNSSSFWYRLNHIQRPWPRVSIIVLFIGLWIGCIASSFYNCSDLCSASGNCFESIRYATFFCDCSGPISSNCPFESTAEPRTGRYEATEALDVLLVVFFFASAFVVGAFHWVWEYEERPYSPGIEVLDQ